MGKKNIQSGTEEFELFQDYWNLYKNNALVENNAEYFEKVVQDTEKFYQKYKTPFAKELGVAYDKVPKEVWSAHVYTVGAEAEDVLSVMIEDEK